MGQLGAPELLLILIGIIVLFGGAKLPKLARSIGEAKREFRQAVDTPSDATPGTAPARELP